MERIKQLNTGSEVRQGRKKTDEMIAELFGGPEGFKEMLDTQSSPAQRENLIMLFDGRFAIDGKK